VQRVQSGKTGDARHPLAEREQRAVDVEEEDRETGHRNTVGLIA
jgi:hypothetical protein